MIEWKKLFDEALEKIVSREWQIGELVETIKLWQDLAEDEYKDLKELARTYAKFQQSGEWDITYDNFIRVCEKVLK